LDVDESKLDIERWDYKVSIMTKSTRLMECNIDSCCVQPWSVMVKLTVSLSLVFRSCRAPLESWRIFPISMSIETEFQICQRR